MSPVGRPDWQQVPRLFAARNVVNLSQAVAAGGALTTTVAAADLDDVIIARWSSPQESAIALILRDPGSVLGDEQVEMATPPNANLDIGGGIVRLARVVKGGDVTLSIANVDAATRTLTIRADTFIGTPAANLIAPTYNAARVISSLAAGADSEKLAIPSASEFSEITILATLGQAYEIRVDWTYPQIRVAPITVGVTTEILAVGAAAAITHLTTIPPAPYAQVYLRNTAGVSGAGRLSLVARRHIPV